MVFSKKGYTIELHTASAVQCQPGVGHLVTWIPETHNYAA